MTALIEHAAAAVTQTPRALATLAVLAALTVAQAGEPALQPDAPGASPAIAEAGFSLIQRPTDASAVALVAGIYYPRAFCPEPKFGEALDIPDVRLLYTPGVAPFSVARADLLLAADGAPLAQTDGFIDRLAGLEQLELLPILRTASTTVFFGINRQGMLGMHLGSNE